jgi:mono/diheme cytochrome c family protein
MSKAAILSGLICTTAWLAPLAASAEEPSGQELFQFHGCVNCHGADGKTPVSKLVPELAGKPADQLYDHATRILSGEGASDEAKLMHAAIHSPANCNAPPSQSEIKTITSWLATQ